VHLLVLHLDAIALKGHHLTGKHLSSAPQLYSPVDRHQTRVDHLFSLSPAFTPTFQLEQIIEGNEGLPCQIKLLHQALLRCEFSAAVSVPG
jgi:hypothetical protein